MAMTGAMTRGGVRLVADDRPHERARKSSAGRAIGDGERAGRQELSAVTGDDLLRLWEDAVSQVQSLVPVLDRTVGELARHVRDKRTAAALFAQDTDPGPDDDEEQ